MSVPGDRAEELTLMSYSDGASAATLFHQILMALFKIQRGDTLQYDSLLSFSYSHFLSLNTTGKSLCMNLLFES